MTSMVAATPATYSAYAAAPTMTSMYATPGASMYMPAGAATAVAGATIAAPQSYVAAPQETVTQVLAESPTQVLAQAPAITMAQIPGFNVPAPQSLTAGLQTPGKVEAERTAYAKALQAQLDKQSAAVMEEAAIKKKMLEQQAKTQIAQAELTIDEALKLDLLRVDQEAQNMLNGLKEAAITQQTTREENCAVAIADYKKKEALDEMGKKSYALQKQWWESETKLMAEYQKVMQKGSTAVATSAVPTMPMSTVV